MRYKYTKKDKEKRELYYKIEKRKQVLKSIVHNLSIPFEIRFLLNQEYMKISEKRNKTGIKNRCFITSRARSVYKHFGLTRLQLKKLVGEQLIPGLSHASW